MTDVPVHRAIANDIAAKIARGVLKPGDRLPSRRQMAEEYGVSEATITNALRVLDAWELTTGHQGKAVYVAQKKAGASGDTPASE